MPDMTIMKRGNRDVVAFETMTAGLNNLVQTIPGANLEPFLRMQKDGSWVYGAEDVEVEGRSRWAINPFSLEHGYVCWTRYEDGRSNVKLGEAMVPSTQPLPDRETLHNHPYPWTEQVGFLLVCTSGDDTGTQTRFSTTSKGGMGEIKNSLLASMIRQIATEQAKGPLNENSKIVPIVELSHSSYTHKAYGKIYTPVFDIKGWGSMKDQSLTETKAEPTPAAASPSGEDAPRRRRRA